MVFNQKHYHKEWWEKNKDSVNKKRRERYVNDTDYQNRCKIASRRYKIQNPEKVRARNSSPENLERKRIRRLVNKDRNSEYNKQYHINNREWRNLYHSLYGKLNRDVLAQRNKKRRDMNPEKTRRVKRDYYHRIEKKDPKFMLNRHMTTLINRCLKNGKGGQSWRKFVDFTLRDLMVHLESQFTDGMSWENRGVHGWHIDHIRPISSFNFQKPEDSEFKECWSLNNLQPLWAKDNCSKNKFWGGSS